MCADGKGALVTHTRAEDPNPSRPQLTSAHSPAPSVVSTQTSASTGTGSSFGVPVPSSFIFLQRAAGNAAATRLALQLSRGSGSPATPLDPVTVQRDGDEAPLGKALRTKDPADAKSVDKKAVVAATTNQRLDLIRILAYQGWVGPRDEWKIEEIWSTFPAAELRGVASREIVMWKHCSEVGAELEKLPAVKELRGSFVQDVRDLAADYLYDNKKYVETQMADAGLPKTEGAKAEPATEQQASALADMQAAAATVANNQAEQERARQVYVGYNPTRVKGGDGEYWDKYAPVKFNPFQPPSEERPRSH